MKSIRTSIIVLIMSSISIFSYAEGFRVNINYVVCHLPDDTSYIEMQFLFLGDGLIYREHAPRQYQAETGVDIQLINEKTSQVIDRQYRFVSGTYPDADAGSGNSMYNLVRIFLPQGTYRMKLTAFDANDSVSAPLTYQNAVKVDFDSEKICLSDIQAISVLTPAEKESGFAKYGYDYMPYFSTFYPENITKLTYFVEIYNLNKQSSEKEFHAVGYIVRDGETTPFSADFQKEKKLQRRNPHLLIQSFPIDSLPSGNYNLVIDVKDAQGVLYSRSTLFFQRSNPSIAVENTAARIDSLPFDTLKLYLEYIRPIATKEEQYFIRHVSPNDYAAAGDFFQNFWYRRNSNNPQEAWFNYYKKVLQVNHNYSTLRFKGYKTDRGHYYLKYGAPNYIEYYPFGENSFAFEIWYYYSFEATRQTNVYFVFYEKDLVTKDFRLLHSNAIGELQNPQWKQILKIDAMDMPMSFPDDTRMRQDDYTKDDNYAY